MDTVPDVSAVLVREKRSCSVRRERGGSGVEKM